MLLRRRRLVSAVRQVRRRDVRDRERALGIGDLAGGDAVDEGLERPSLVAVPAERAEHRDTNLLSYVVDHVGAAGIGPQPRPHVAVGHGTHPGEQVVESCPVAVARKRGKIPELDPVVGVRYSDLGHPSPPRVGPVSLKDGTAHIATFLVAIRDHDHIFITICHYRPVLIPPPAIFRYVAALVRTSRFPKEHRPAGPKTSRAVLVSDLRISGRDRGRDRPRRAPRPRACRPPGSRWSAA